MAPPSAAEKRPCPSCAWDVSVRFQEPMSRFTTHDQTEIRMADLIRDVDSIVIVLMENRSFDHILASKREKLLANQA
jgi:hypothetical protein